MQVRLVYDQSYSITREADVCVPKVMFTTFIKLVFLCLRRVEAYHITVILISSNLINGVVKPITINRNSICYAMKAKTNQKIEFNMWMMVEIEIYAVIFNKEND